LAAVGATAWIVVQAFVNICGVLGLLPITGMMLPLVSYDPWSLLVTMITLGMLMSFAKREPDAIRAIAAGTGLVRRFLVWLGLYERAPIAQQGPRIKHWRS
jgi:cell division protein FtsW